MILDKKWKNYKLDGHFCTLPTKHNGNMLVVLVQQLAIIGVNDITQNVANFSECWKETNYCCWIFRFQPGVFMICMEML